MCAGIADSLTVARQRVRLTPGLPAASYHRNSNELELRVARSCFAYQLSNCIPIHPVVYVAFALEFPAPICSFTDDKGALSTPEQCKFVSLAQSPRPKPELARPRDKWLTVGHEAPDGFSQAVIFWLTGRKSNVEFEDTDICIKREIPASLLLRR